ncbi:T9SS type B sorting domain-containing protein [Maribacter algarum]|uniref:T9SS type B sorting domain-containing protein n=1 Tax=Maribacter algarum (ex Zhang et al. 2020) TaxID=2578118 RepID=A0A5S3PGK0_9FLAO|nr:T9SS type B sorting domain-containing protein [Maribacter algarum]TMM53260.1 T9SS type B sorting domain-containing protein [Maribacter algarum]
MHEKLTYLFCLFGFIVSQAQVCPELIGPLDGDTDVAVTTTISWENLKGGQIYLISLGTTPGGTDIIDRKTSGTNAIFTPPKGLPEKTRIHVSLQIIDGNFGSFDCEIGSFITEDVTDTPSCTTLRDPLNNAVFVREEVNIVWNYAPLATGYRISLGTSPDKSDIAANINVGNQLFYDPPADLPVNAIVYARVVPYNENGVASGICPEESFAIRTVTSSLDCTKLTYPKDGAIEVPKSLALEWETVEAATGYKVSIGISPFPVDIFYTAFVDTANTSVLDFDSSHKYWVTIIPYNDAGEAVGCTTETFTTIVHCGPFTDDLTGETVVLNPKITLPDRVSICNNQLPYLLSANDRADGYRWFRINVDETTDLISETKEIQLNEDGTYLLEIYDRVALFESVIECSTTKEFVVFIDDGPIIISATATPEGEFGDLTIVVIVDGNGQYEYSIEGEDGQFQDSNIFENLPDRSYTVYVREKDGCGIAKRLVQKSIIDGFPKFFTPNGDGINDFWQFELSSETRKKQLGSITIFDRYGVLLLQIDPRSKGWDGTLNGSPLPAADYWYRVFVEDGKQFKGHFALKR